MNRKIQDEAKTYRRQMIEMGEEGKTFIRLQADQILGEPDDEQLGKWVREMMLKKIEDIDKHIEYIKSLEKQE